MIRTDPPPRALDSDVEAYLKLRIAVINHAWRDLESWKQVRSALEFFESPRFDWWSGGGVDLTDPRENARKIAARVRKEHVATMRRKLRSPMYNIRDDAVRFFRCPSSTWWLQDEGR